MNVPAVPEDIDAATRPTEPIDAEVEASTVIAASPGMVSSNGTMNPYDAPVDRGDAWRGRGMRFGEDAGYHRHRPDESHHQDHQSPPPRQCAASSGAEARPSPDLARVADAPQDVLHQLAGIRAHRQLGQRLLQQCIGEGGLIRGHASASSARSRARRALHSRDFAVPTGIDSWRATSSSGMP